MPFPKPSGDFEWVQESWGMALQCAPLAAIAPHRFSTRQLFLEGVRDNHREGWSALARAIGVEVEALVRMRQMHGTGVVEARRENKVPASCSMAYDEWPQGDIAISRDPSLAVTVRMADCVPILLGDRRNGTVAAIHAGWKGTALGAAATAIDAMTRTCGSEPADIVAAVGPSIGPCCYEVGSELLERFAAHPDASRWFSREHKPKLDLWRATCDQLARAGVPTSQIHVCKLCTFDHPALFHSYRRERESAGRLTAVIRSAPDRPL